MLPALNPAVEAAEVFCMPRIAKKPKLAIIQKTKTVKTVRRYFFNAL
jgi:hypothetical protein